MSTPLLSSAAPAVDQQDRLRILTWHVHGNYLYSLTHLPHKFVIPVSPDNRPGYSALGPAIPWGDNVSMVSTDKIRNERFDCVIYQSRPAFENDRHTLLTPAQRALPSIYIEHNPPEPHPTDTEHWFRHDRGILVHVTNYNALMWKTPPAVATRVVEHGVALMSGAHYSGEVARGITVINHLNVRGRRVGADVFVRAAQQVPLDLIGMGSEQAGGLGEIPNRDVPVQIARYRFFFTPVRYASLGLSLIEAMMVGMPVVGIAATELPSVIRNGEEGYLDTDEHRLIECMHALLHDAELARKWGRAAQQKAQQRFGIARFVSDWEAVLMQTIRS